jgi:hypothetical protein
MQHGTAEEGTRIDVLQGLCCLQSLHSVFRSLQLRGSHRLAVQVHRLDTTAVHHGCLLPAVPGKICDATLSECQFLTVRFLDFVISAIPLVEIEVPALNRASNHPLRQLYETTSVFCRCRLLQFPNEFFERISSVTWTVMAQTPVCANPSSIPISSKVPWLSAPAPWWSVAGESFE